MTPPIPNPSFIIINSQEEVNYEIKQFFNKNYAAARLQFFESLSTYLASEEFVVIDKVVLLFEDCFNLYAATDRTAMLQITAKCATIVIRRNLNLEYTKHLIQLGVCEILTEDQYTIDQLQQSIIMSLSRYSHRSAELPVNSKVQFFDILSNYYGNLVSSVDSNLNFLKSTKSIIEKLCVESTSLTGSNLLDHVHPEDLWNFGEMSSYFDKRDSLVLFPIRIKVANNLYHDFEVNFIKDLNNDDHFIINLKDLTEEQPKEEFRRENNERFSAIADATNSTIYEYFAESKLLFTSDSKGVYGLIEGEYLEQYYQQYHDRIHPDDRDRMRESFSNSFKHASLKPCTDEFRLLKPNGRYQVILDRYRIFLREGKEFKRIGALTDITEIKAQNSLIAFEKQVYEMNADPKYSFSDVIAYLETRMEDLIPNSKCMVLATNEKGQIISLGQREYNNNFLNEIEKYCQNHNPLYNKKAQYAKISECQSWKDTKEVTDRFGFNYFWSSPATNKEREISANILLFFGQDLIVEDIEEILMQRITVLLGMLVAKNKALIETRTSRERYEMVAKATSDTIWDWKINLDEVTWNKGILESFGYSKEEIDHSSTWWFSHVHPEDSIRVSIKLYHFLEEGGDKWQDEYRFECADGSYKYILDRGLLEKDENGKPARMIGSMQDITQSKKEEERLKLLSAAITQANDAVIITETPRSIYAIPKIVYVNPAFSKMTGYLYEEVVGKAAAIFIGKNAMVEQQSILSKATEFNKEFIFEALNQRKNGEEYWGKFSMIPVLNNRGEHSHWISIQSDITDQKEQEKEKEQLIQELTRHNNDLKQFSYITSHNLRAPLSNLIGLLNLVEDVEIEDEDLREIIEGFSKSTHLLNQTVNDLIKIVIIKDNLSIDKELINIQETIQNILDQLSYTISQYSPLITINTRKSPNLLVNKIYIESIFLNLLTNSLRYSDPDRVLEIDISTDIIGNETVLFFRDNGIGIDLVRNSDKLFGLYQRFHDYPDSKGLGLYLVKSQVLAMGGTISVESELGMGSSFILKFKN